MWSSGQWKCSAQQKMKPTLRQLQVAVPKDHTIQARSRALEVTDVTLGKIHTK